MSMHPSCRTGGLPMTDAVRFRFIGDLHAASFAEFAEHRALRLDIALTVVESGPGSATFDVEGAPDLVDMFEMACSLGPLACIVRDVERRDIGHAAVVAKDM
jgi:hypothetical protein